MGNVNAQIGGNMSRFENAVGTNACGRQTENGDCFIQFFSVNSLKIGSLMFQHNYKHKIMQISNNHKTAT